VPATFRTALLFFQDALPIGWIGLAGREQLLQVIGHRVDVAWLVLRIYDRLR